MQPCCRHCRRPKVNRPRGLCWSCYCRPGVRGLYPSASKFARRGVPDGHGPRPRPEPTRALAGSAEKLAELERRAAAGQELFVPGEPQQGVVVPVGPVRVVHVPRKVKVVSQ